MSFKGLGKKYKRILAFLLAAALFFNAWIDFDFSVFAEGEETETTPTTTWTIELSEESAEYTGTDVKPTVTVKRDSDGDGNLDDVTGDVTITWKNGEDVIDGEIIDAGTYTVTVTGTVDETEVTEDTTFNVTPFDLSTCEIVVDSSVSFVYSGIEIKPENTDENKVITLTKSGAVVSEEWYKLEVTPAINVGESVVVEAVPADGNTNITGGKTQNFSIEKKALTEDMLVITGVESSYTYNGSKHEPTVTVEVEGNVWQKDSDYTVTYGENTTVENGGSVTITATGIGSFSKNYTETSKTVTFAIVRPEIGDAAIIPTGDQLEGRVDTWYSTPVELKADRYQISTNENGEWKEKLEVTEDYVGTITYYLKDTNGGISEAKTVTINVDMTKPVFTDVVEPSTGWAQEKTVKFKVNEANLQRVTYTLEGNSEQSVSPDENGIYTITITDEIVDGSKLLTIKAIDNAGNAETITKNIEKIDRTAPTFGTEFAGGSKWTNVDFTEDLGINDNVDNDVTVVVTPEGAVVNKDNGSYTVTFSATTEGEKIYTFIATDDAGNESQATYTVSVDKHTPVLEFLTNELIDQKDGAAPYYSSEDGLYWFADPNVTIPVGITDGEDGKSSPYMISFSYNADMQGTIGTVSAGGSREFLDECKVNLNNDKLGTDGKIVVYFQVTDNAGNISAIKSLTLGYDEEPSKIDGLAVKGISDSDYWVNGIDSDDGSLEFTINVTESKTPIKTIEYKEASDTDYTAASFTKIDGGYRFNTVPVNDQQGYIYSVRITNEVDREYTFNNVAVNVDRTIPEEKAYVRFVSDTLGDNNVTVNDLGEAEGTYDEENKTWTSKMMEMITGAWNKIWGKTTINFEVYVFDELSGIANVELSCGEGQINNLQKTEGLTATIESKEYTVYEGTLTCKEENVSYLEAADFTITSVTDIAGNTRENIVLNNADGSSLIYLDSIAPKLMTSAENVEVTNDNFAQGEIYFTNANNASVTLTIEERFFAEKTAPIVKLEKKGPADSEWTLEREITEWVSIGNYQWACKVDLTKTDGEIEYRLCLEEYTDPSGNVMIDYANDSIVTNVTDNGSYTSSTFVVDDDAPMLTYSVVGNTNCSIGDSTVYNNEGDNDLKVNVVIDDTPQYFDKDNLKVSMVSANNEEIGNFTISDKTPVGNAHTYEFNCEEKVTDNSEFYVKVEYVDQAGNALIANENVTKPLEEGKVITEGIYNSKTYIIDNVAPVFGVAYGEVSRIIKKEGDAWTDGGEDKIPQAGYDAYFNNGIEVTFTIEETYTNFTSSALEHHKLKVIKKSNATAEEEIVCSSVVGMNGETDESQMGDSEKVNVEWSKNDTIYTVKVSIPKTEDNSNDGEYQIIFATEDCAGNKMVVSDTADAAVSDLFADGIYTSPKLILDTKAPETDAHIQFISDVVGDNQSTDQIYPMACEAPVEIWANKKLEFKVYVRDTYSGVKEIQENDSIQMSYTDGSETVVLELTENGTSQIEGNGANVYTVYTGTLSNTANNELKIEDFHIDWIKDVAGNEMNTPITLNGTIYLDDVSPKLEVGYSNAYQVINSNWKTVKDSAGNKITIPQKDCTAFYDSNIEIILTVNENATKAIGEALEHHELQIIKDGASIYSSRIGMDNEVSENAEEENGEEPVSVVWEHADESNLYKATIQIKADQVNNTADGDYQITFSSKDCTGNLMEAKENSGITVDDGIYTSPLLVLDTVKPEVIAAYEDVTGLIQTKTDKNGNERDYFRIPTNYNITVKDRNIRYSELINVLAKKVESKNIAVDIAGKPIDANIKDSINGYKDEKYVMHVLGNEDAVTKLFVLSLDTDANYTIPVEFEDLAGNKADIFVGENDSNQTPKESYTEYVTVDRTSPQVVYHVKNYLSEDSQYVKEGSDTEDSQGIDYKRGGNFFKEIAGKFISFFFKNGGGMEIEIIAKDTISDVESINYSFEKGETKEIKNDTDEGVMKAKIELGSSVKDQVSISAVDYSNNNSENKVGAFVVETENGHIEFQDVTPANREEGNEKFYNQDVNINITFEDTGSGIDKREVKFDENVIGELQYVHKANAEGNTIIDNYTANGTITTTSYNKNNIIVSASMVDNAGNDTGSIECQTIFNIDVTKPTIKVTYNNNEPYNENYYNEPRIATVEITERNFDENDVVWLISSTDGPEPIVSGWSHSGEDDDSNVHTCTVTFEEDSDYTFSLEFEDMAGNKAEYSQVDEFTIDKTLPVMEVTYNNNEFLNEYYYNSSRTATIDILEHNFDPNGVEILVTADNAAGGASISGWTRNGDHNIATVTFANDAEYTLDIQGVDLANNELEDYEQDHFVVDQTVPELEIYDIENMSANKGEVRPGIRYFDTNYDAEGTVVLFKGYHNGEQEMDGDKSLQANGLELKLHDIPHVQSNDDVYTMEATVYDLAGNSSEASVMFSVNRFGSVYTFDEATKALVGEGGKYYTNEEQDIVIVETNVDTLEFKEITCNLNGKLTTMKEGEDFDVYLDGTEATWKQYTYRIFEENFQEEGTYIITTYSEDKATNTSDNNSKGKSVEFVVDKTSPSVLISGVEDGGQYREDKHEMTLDIEDNIRVAEMIVDINGVETRFNTAQINEVDGKITMDIESDNQWQVIKVTVVDAAGNMTVADELSVLVTANLFVQFVSNQAVLYGTLGVAGVGAFAVWWFIFRKKKMTDAS